MLKLIYHVAVEQKDSEIKWLKAQRIYPAVTEQIYWKSDSSVLETRARFGMIVDNDAALAIKLRHNLELQSEYRQK